MHEEVKIVGEEWIWHTFLGVFLPHKKKYDFPKFMACPNTNLTAIDFHSQGINYLNQLLEEINDWVHKTKKVVESFMGSPIDIWIKTTGSMV